MDQVSAPDLSMLKVGTFAIGYCPTPSGPEGSSGKQPFGVPEIFLAGADGPAGDL